MSDLVECLSSSEYADRPVAIWWLGQRLEIGEILERKRTPEGKYFRVRVKEGQVFELFYNELSDDWQNRQL